MSTIKFGCIIKNIILKIMYLLFVILNQSNHFLTLIIIYILSFIPSLLDNYKASIHSKVNKGTHLQSYKIKYMNK